MVQLHAARGLGSPSTGFGVARLGSPIYGSKTKQINTNVMLDGTSLAEDSPLGMLSSDYLPL